MTYQIQFFLVLLVCRAYNLMTGVHAWDFQDWKTLWKNCMSHVDYVVAFSFVLLACFHPSCLSIPVDAREQQLLCWKRNSHNRAGVIFQK
jgi:hypothetical protein